MTENQKFSIILTTIRNYKAIEPLFRTTDKESELIITDSNYNNETKEWLAAQSGYSQIVYAPVSKFGLNLTKDNVKGYNLALMYAENDWIVRADDNLEFKNDFFSKAREDIEYFNTNYQNTNFCIVGQKLWASLNQLKWNDYLPSKASRYTNISNPMASFSFGLMPIEFIYKLNGYNEIYDFGWGFDDIDIILRGLASGYKFWFDRELMGYSEPHVPAASSFAINRMIYDLQAIEIGNGKTYAFNGYNLRALQNQFLLLKDDYIIER